MEPHDEKVRIDIVYEPRTGAVSVTGPIQNKTLCYGMLEMAKDVIKDFSEKAAAEKKQEALIS